MAYLFKRGKKSIWYIKFYRGEAQILRSLKTTNYRAAKNRAKILEGGSEPEEEENTDRLRLRVVLEEFCQYLKSNRTHKS